MRHAEKGESAVQGHAKGLSSPFSLLFLSWSDVIWIQQHTKCEKEEEAVFIGISRKGGGGGGEGCILVGAIILFLSEHKNNSAHNFLLSLPL